jgi:hypothetical protein
VKPELYVDTCEQIRKSMKDALVQQGCKF